MTLFNINLKLFEKSQNITENIRCYGNILEKLNLNTGKHKLVDSVDAYKDMIGKKSDAHDSKVSTRFASRLKNGSV